MMQGQREPSEADERCGGALDGGNDQQFIDYARARARIEDREPTPIPTTLVPRPEVV